MNSSTVLVTSRDEPLSSYFRSKGHASLSTRPNFRFNTIRNRIVHDGTPLPPQAATPEDDEDLLADNVWCDPPVKMDYGYNVKCVVSLV
ncbi:hypothetical protein F5X98DRAFT_208715 [Xylaria grammica]|nr:hypothetical protein F5X98DRAFT_208715 [Xylaria grammica]